MLLLLQLLCVPLLKTPPSPTHPTTTTINKNKQVIRLKAGTMLSLPLPGETKETIVAAEARERERLRKKRKLDEKVRVCCCYHH